MLNWYARLPTKSRPEDVFIEAFLSAYEDLTWADADKDWLDRRVDGAVEMLATRKSDGKTLAIEHTVIEPFVKDIEDFKFFEQAFLKIEDDKSLVVPDRWIQIFIPIGTLRGHRKAAAREVIVKVVHEWIRANGLSLRDGEHEYPCAVTGVPGTGDLDIKQTINATPLAKHGKLNVRRQQVGNDFGDVVKKAPCNKLPKLAKQKAGEKHRCQLASVQRQPDFRQHFGGVADKAIQGQLRHSKAEITRDVYMQQVDPGTWSAVVDLEKPINAKREAHVDAA